MFGPIAYNYGTGMTGTLRKNTVSFGADKNIPYDDNYGGTKWYAQPVIINNSYLIFSDTYTQGYDTQPNSHPIVWSSQSLSDSDLLELINRLPERVGATFFTDLTAAINWLSGTNKYAIVNRDLSYNSLPVMDSLELLLDSTLSASYPIGGTAWTNLGGSGNSGVITGTPVYSPYDMSIQFNGTNTRCELSQSINLKSNQSWTVSAWINTSNDTVILSNNSGGPVNCIFRILSGVVAYSHYSGSWLVEYGNVNVKDGKWHYLCFVNKGDNTMDLYVDGEFDINISSIIGNGSHDNLVNTFCGSWSSYSLMKAGGFSIHRKALSAIELKQNYDYYSTYQTSKFQYSTCIDGSIPEAKDILADSVKPIVKNTIASQIIDVYSNRVSYNGGIVENVGELNQYIKRLRDNDLYKEALDIIVPNGYSQGMLYGIKNNRNVTFSRSSVGTRYNSNNILVEESNNLITTPINGWSGLATNISTGALDPNGNTTAFVVSTSVTTNSHYISYATGLTADAGCQKTFSVYLKYLSHQYVGVWLNDGGLCCVDLINSTISAVGTSNNTPANVFVHKEKNGWIKVTVLQSSPFVSIPYVYIVLHNASNGTGSTTSYAGTGTGIYVWNPSVEFSRLDYNTPYISSSRSNMPRYNYYNKNNCLLLEKPITNYCVCSNFFSDNIWSKGSSTVTLIDYLNPSGTNRSYKIATMAVSYSGCWQYVNQSSDYWTASIFAKKKDLNYVAFVNMTGVSTCAWFNISNGTIGTVSAGYTARIYPLDNGWYRCSVSNNSPETGTYLQMLFTNTDNSNIGAVGETYIYGAQLEKSKYPTSYIPTPIGSTYTRVQDSMRLSSYYDLTDFTISIVFSCIDLTTDFMLFGSWESTNNSYIYVTAAGIMYFKAGTGAEVSLGASGFVTGNKHRVVISRSGSTVKYFLDGAIVSTTTAYTTTFRLDAICGGKDGSGASSPYHMDGDFYNFVMYNSALSDTKCINLTSI
jgi:hypothetical protein